MADPNNTGQFGNREDTEAMAKEGGKSSHGRRGRTSGNRASGAAGRTEAAARGGRHSRRRASQ